MIKSAVVALERGGGIYTEGFQTNVILVLAGSI
jgi:hypothetical protein